MQRDTLIKWNNNRLLNPLTNKKIKENGKTYLKFLKEWKLIEDDDINIDKLLGPLKDYIDCEDNKDIISQEDIWILKDGKKVKSDDIKYLFSYMDDDNKYRGFNIKSIEMLINKNNLKHPITNQEIKEIDIDRAKKLIKYLYENGELKEKKIDNIKKELDNMIYNLNKLGYFVEEKWFKKLEKVDYQKLNYEIGDLLKNNLEKNIYLKIKGFKKNKMDLINNDIKDIKLMFYQDINEILEMEIKVFGAMIIICAFGMLIDEIKTRYSDIMAFN